MGKLIVFLGLFVGAIMAYTAHASDPDLTTDFNVSNPSVDSFSLRGFGIAQPQGKGVAVGKPASFVQLPGLNGLGLTAVLFQFGAKSQIDPHTHPRATEVFYVLSGQVDVGFVDTTNTLFETTVKTGDLFVFPKGLLHWQRNGESDIATGFSALSSENPGTLSVVEALFTASGKGIPEDVLATALGTNQFDIENLKKNVAIRNNITLTY